MKKLTVLLILAVLVVSMAYVYAQGNGQGDQNKSQGKNQTGECEEKGNSCCIDDKCKAGVSNLICAKDFKVGFHGCDENCTPIVTCKMPKNNITFLPYQKRNESECLTGCKCVGAVMSCPTADGKIMTIEAGRSGNIITISVSNNKSADTELEVETENDTNNKTKLNAKLSNGRKAEVKIMPDTASEKAIERLGLNVCSQENNCVIQLKEVPVGNNKTAAYEVQVDRHVRILALFSAKAREKVQVDASTGEVIVVKKPWWALLAKEE